MTKPRVRQATTDQSTKVATGATKATQAKDQQTTGATQANDQQTTGATQAKDQQTTGATQAKDQQTTGGAQAKDQQTTGGATVKDKALALGEASVHKHKGKRQPYQNKGAYTLGSSKGQAFPDQAQVAQVIGSLVPPYLARRGNK